MLECYGSASEDRAVIGEIVNAPPVSWNLGRRFTSTIPSPIEVHLDPDQPGVLMPMFERGILLMRDDMLATLAGLGVDNLDLYPAVLTDPSTGVSHENYKAVNIIGAIIAANLAESVYTPHGDAPLIDADFDRLVIDESKARNRPLFRLAECVSAKIVHKRVKFALETLYPELDFIEPENWVG